MKNTNRNAVNPLVLQTAGINGDVLESNASKQDNSTEKRGGKYFLIAEIEDGPRVTVIGRDAWCLKRLIQSGSKGCTPIDEPAPRWSGYVHKLRKLGFYIETIHEAHEGPFAGTHARYVLHSPVSIVVESEHG